MPTKSSAKGRSKSTARNDAIRAQAESIFELTKMSWATRDHARLKGQFDVSESEFLVLDLLTKNESMNVGEIQRAIGVLPAQMSRIIRALESKFSSPLIRCEINPTDKRKIDVSLSDMGRKAHNTYSEARLAQSYRVLENLSDHDRNEFMRILALMRETIRKASEEQ